MGIRLSVSKGKRLIAQAFSKSLESADLWTIQRLIVKLRDAERLALKEGVDTTKTSYMMQGIIIVNLAQAIDRALNIRERRTDEKRIC